MTEIRILPPDVAERIAAGEVIDSPEAVVKELIENALDAGASDIRVDVQGGGLRLIRVADDGCGIPPDQIELAFQRHATSKLRELSDLERIATFGFRGEALASIAAVAEVSVVSAVEGQPGARCVYRAGKPVEKIAAARTRGTTVSVTDLFAALPARLKFLRSQKAEVAAIGAMLRRFALANPNTRFALTINGRLHFRHEGRGLAEALNAVYGSGAAEALMPLEPVEVEGTRISGVIGGRAATRSTRSAIALFVNRRPVVSRPLLDALEEGYRRFLPSGRHPLAALFIDLPPEDVDVNIHPAKLDVRLRHERAICAALTSAVRAAFGRHPTPASPPQRLTLDGAQPRLRGLAPRVAEERGGWRVGDAAWEPGAAVHGGDALPAVRLLGQANGALIVAESADGLLLIDQHRAHERVIYELLAATRAPQALIEPALIDLSVVEQARLAERLAALAELGLICEEFGARRILVRAAPVVPGTSLSANAIAEILHAAAAEQDDWRDRLLATIACRTAIRKGRALTPAEARDLVEKLSRTRSPASCPHGSPIVLQIGHALLARQFDW
jgi:DNA mismatch repair protein MutL